MEGENKSGQNRKTKPKIKRSFYLPQPKDYKVGREAKIKIFHIFALLILF